MSQTSQQLDMRAMVHDALMSVFETMLSMKLEPANIDQIHATDSVVNRVSGCVGFGGENVNGAIYIHIPDEFARKIVCAMLGLEPSDIDSDAVVNDGIGEMCNMVAGSVKSTLCDANFTCAVSTPAIIRGSAYHIEPVPEVKLHQLPYTCEGHPLLMELHIKFNS